MEVDAVKAIIEKKEDFLRRHVILSMSVIDKLRQHDVIGDFTATQIAGNQSNPNRQVTLLLGSIKTRGIESFQGFLNVLRMTFHGWVADDILDSTIEMTDVQKHLPSVLHVRDVINRYQRDELNKAEPSLKQTCEVSGSERFSHDVNYKIPDMKYHAGNQVDQQRAGRYRANNAEHLNERHFRDVNVGKGAAERYSPVTQIPSNLRDLQRIFDIETTSVSKSIAVLKQEELTIKALLQQNLREQQELLGKQEALTGIKDQMKQIGKSATQLYKQDPDSSDSMSRLRRLQRTYWASNSR